MTMARKRRHDFIGFTLIELLLVLAMIGVLIAMYAPSLAKLRSSARDAVNLSNLRTHAAVLEMYTRDWGGWYPCFVDADKAIQTVKGGGIEITFDHYFEESYLWNVALVVKVT
jgi:prepilin-type N-terminal cleavage/methylation domain-containing protein